MKNPLPHRTIASLIAGLLLAFGGPKTTAAGIGAFTTGGGFSSGGVYANQATLGQIAGPIISGGAYEITSGFQSVIPRRGEPRITKIFATTSGRFRLRVIADVGAALRLESTPSLGAAAIWRLENSTAVGTGAEVDLITEASSTAARFYRVRAD